MDATEIAKYVGDVVAGCAIIAAIWKPPAGSALRPIYEIISAIGANVGKASNDPMIPPTGKTTPDMPKI